MPPQPDAGATPAPPRVEMRHAGIVGLGSALPEESVPSDAIAARLGVQSGWIERRTGIRSRRRAPEGARVSDLGARAARAALRDAGREAVDVDVVLVATLAADEITPNAAPLVAHAIGATGAGAMDIGAACTGFLGAMTLGASLIEAHRANCVLVVGAELLSRHVDLDDRATAGLFGDAAGAVVLAAGAEGRVGRAVLSSDGSAGPLIVAPRDTGLIRMDGHETFQRAVTALSTSAIDAVAANGLTLDDIDLFVFHQANARILSAVGRELGVAVERVVDVIADLGNTSSASIPLALAAAREENRLSRGDRVLVGAVGAGFTWGATVVEWGSA